MVLAITLVAAAADAHVLHVKSTTRDSKTSNPSSRRTGRASCCLDYPTHHAGTLASTHTPKALPRVQRGWEQATRRARDGGMERTHGITTWYSHRRAQTGCSRCALVCVINPPCPPLTTMRLSDALGGPARPSPASPPPTGTGVMGLRRLAHPQRLLLDAPQSSQTKPSGCRRWITLAVACRRPPRQLGAPGVDIACQHDEEELVGVSSVRSWPEWAGSRLGCTGGGCSAYACACGACACGACAWDWCTPASM